VPQATSPTIAVLLPCYNEEAAIGATVAGFRAALPGATVYVYDNNSKDRTREVAAEAGAVVRSETQQGKGNVVRRMFADIDADAYVMADGDLTYDPAAAPAMLEMLLADQLDMVVGTRRHERKDAYRGGHVLGNRVFTGLLAGLFGRSFSDIFSGYRVFSRRFVKSFPVLSAGFEIETEMSVLRRHRRAPDARRLPARDPAGPDLFADGAGAALPDGDPGHRDGHRRSAVRLCRPDPRYGDAGPARGQKARLSFASRAAPTVARLHH
jgi:glycosyltransferase involved in cell wall biosynthesis